MGYFKIKKSDSNYGVAEDEIQEIKIKVLKPI